MSQQITRKWKTLALITAPILLAGSVYAFTSVPSSNEDNGITGTLISSERVTLEELAPQAAAQPAPMTVSDAVTTPSVEMEAYNPFAVYTPPTAPSESRKIETKATPANNGDHNGGDKGKREKVKHEKANPGKVKQEKAKQEKVKHGKGNEKGRDKQDNS